MSIKKAIPLKINYLVLYFLFSTPILSLVAQSPTVHFKTGHPIFQKNNAAYPQVQADELVEGHYYRLLQFEEIPNITQFQQLKAADIELLEYIRKNTYIAALPKDIAASTLDRLGIRFVQLIPSHLKIGAALNNRALALATRAPNQRQTINILLKYYKNLNQQQVLKWCADKDIQILQYNDYQNYIKIKVAIHQVYVLANLPWIAYLEIAPTGGEPDDLPAQYLHRSNILNTNNIGGRHYDGAGVNVLVRDDGIIGEHLDFLGRLDQTHVRRDLGAHAEGVAGIIGGAGNIDPNVAGMARAAFIYNAMYEPTFLDNTIDLHLENQVMISNSSYSNECNVFLPNTQIVDQQMKDYPQLLHVFSAGNSNGTDCDYGAGTEWGNITGGHKQGKNVLTVGNVLTDGRLGGSSSRGPAYDGRIKPDIVANGAGQQSTGELYNYQGFGGTSAAAPSVAGVTAQLYQAYRELNDGEQPEAALIKTCLLNTANDLGQPGPDFKFGWGHLNALRAVKTLEEERYEKGDITQGQFSQHNITVPEGTKELRVMTYWTDVPGSEMATKALVNNLNTQIISPDNSIHLPLVLNSSPEPDLLDLPAVEGLDTLNNMEQIRVVNPTAGLYALLVEGLEIPFGTQSYVMTYEFIGEDITLTYPYGGEGLEEGKTTLLHWDAYGQEGEFLIEYKENNNSNWAAVATVAGTERTYEWSISTTVTGQAYIRISRNGITTTNEQPFSIIGIPENVRVHQVCPDYIQIGWDSVQDATAYQIFSLNGNYIDSIGITNEVFYTIPVASPVDFNNWFAVSAHGANDAKGQRTIAKSWIGELRDCPQDYDLKMNEILNQNIDDAVRCNMVYEHTLSVKIFNQGLLTADSISFAFQINDDVPIIELSADTLGMNDTLIYTFQTPIQVDTSGVYTLKTWVDIPNEAAPFNDTLASIFKVLIYETPDTLDVQEDFESADVFPDDWVIYNPDTSQTWIDVETLGSNGHSTNAMLMDNFRYGIEHIGQRDMMQLAPVDLSETTQPVLLFDLAYTYYTDEHWDTLAIEISIDCGMTFQAIYEKTKDELATVPPSILRFEPTRSADWRREIVDLSAYLGETIFVRFVNKMGWGNSLYLDNIHLLEYEDVRGHFLELKSIVQPQTNTVFSCEESYQQPVEIYVQNYDIQAVSNFVVAYQINDDSIVKDTITDSILPNMTYQHRFSSDALLDSSATYQLTTWVNRLGEEELFQDSAQANFELVFPRDLILNLNLLEDFENTETLPEGWRIENPDEQITWEKVEVIGANGEPTQALSVENFIYNQVNTEDVLQLPLVDIMVAADEIPALYFDVAYTYKSVSLTDALRIDVSVDCGQTFETIFYKEEEELATAPASGAAFTPDAVNDWRKEVVNLSDYVGQEVLLRFVNVNGFGNNLYLDHIEIKPLDFAAPTADFIASETTLCPGDLVFFTDLSSGDNRSYFWDFGAGASMPTSMSSGSQVLSFQEPGLQEVTLVVSNAAGADTASILMTILDVPQADFDYTQLDNSIIFENLSSDTVAVIWDFGDGIFSELVHPTHTYEKSGTYTVTLTTANECGENSFSQELIVVVSSIQNTAQQQIQLYPNPTTGVLYLNMSAKKTEELTLRLLNVQQQVLLEKKWSYDIKNNILEFDISTIEQGIYLLSVQGQETSLFFKIVKLD